MTGRLLVHATAVAIEGGAVLLRGPPGAGKSDLALRLIDGGGALVADDQAALRREGEDIVVRAPSAIAGLLEIRGLGVVRIGRVVRQAPLVLIVDLVRPEAVERMPDGRVEEVLGRAIPLLALAPFEASAPAKLRLARRAFAAAPLPAIIGP